MILSEPFPPRLLFLSSDVSFLKDVSISCRPHFQRLYARAKHHVKYKITCFVPEKNGPTFPCQNFIATDARRCLSFANICFHLLHLNTVPFFLYFLYFQETCHLGNLKFVPPKNLSSKNKCSNSCKHKGHLEFCLLT